MLTWGVLNIIGVDAETRAGIAEEQRRVSNAVDAEITRRGIERNSRGRAKAYLYCLETVDPQTGRAAVHHPTSRIPNPLESGLRPIARQQPRQHCARSGWPSRV